MLVWCHHGAGRDGATGVLEVGAPLGVVPQTVRGSNKQTLPWKTATFQEEGRSRNGLRDGKTMVHPAIQQTCIEHLLCARHCSKP